MNDEIIQVRVNFPDGNSDIAETPPYLIIEDSIKVESVERVVKIDPDGRYLILVPDNVPIEELIYMRDLLREWWSGDDKFLVISGDMKLERVDKD